RPLPAGSGRWPSPRFAAWWPAGRCSIPRMATSPVRSMPRRPSWPKRRGHDDDAIDDGAGAAAIPGGAVRRARWRGASLCQRMLRDFRPRQCSRHRGGALRAARPDDLLPGTQRAGHGPRRGRLRPTAQRAGDGCRNACFETRVWGVPRSEPESRALDRAAAIIRGSDRPMIVAGGGVIYSEATDALRQLVDATGIPVGERQAGRGSLPYDHASNQGSVGATGTLAANRLAREADVVIGIGTRWTDFTTAS